MKPLINHIDMKYISHFTLTLIKKDGGITIFYGYNIAILSVISKNGKAIFQSITAQLSGRMTLKFNE
jgi:hypothetical protein